MNKENLNKIEGTELNKIPMKFYDRNDGIVEMKGIYDEEIVIYEHDFDNNEVKAVDNNAEIDSDDNVDSNSYEIDDANEDVKEDASMKNELDVV
ncbi:hypothetical protein C2G38_2163235 [Gigaspora rosea]|uniref:Uncharacterized protein n=1 Tax=Gigaspora rosea TaxID=44941 RepID=A0A397VXF2_9GLOM|nr:hypothetical protein C2G38_2163235 [Gigaspora rosea]